ncbi:MAG: EAL domain-containing protein [Aquificae bacterium]|nr:EAL domain-containing protein [Aquificota bacterium]
MIKKFLLRVVPVALLSITLNLFGLPLFFDSLNILLGGTFVYFALEAFGFTYALITALVLGVQRILLYQDPLGGVFVPVELIGVFVVKALFKQNIITSGWVFWTFFGWILYASFASSFLGMNMEVSILLSFKEAVNSLINITLGSMTYILYSYYISKERRISYADILFVFLAGTAIIPMFLKSVYQAKSEERYMISTVRHDIEIISKNVSESVLYWLDIHLNAVRELANRLVIWGPKNKEQLQKETEAIRRAFREFHACYIADQNATAITFYPEINPKGKYMIGTNFNYRPYYRDVKKTLSHTFTEVFIAKFALKPVVGIAVPAVDNGKFLGYAYCGLRLDRLERIVKEFSLKEGAYITLVDKHGRVIVSNMESLKPMEKFRRGNFLMQYGDLTLEIKDVEGEKSHPIRLEKYLHSYFYKQQVLRRDVGWTVIMEVSLVPYMMNLFDRLSFNFVLIYIFAFLAFLLSKFLSSVSTDPVMKLSQAISTLSKTLERRPHIYLPKTNIVEVVKLTESFEDMAKKVLDYMEELRKMAYFDPLTGLPNRALLRDRIESAISRAKRNGTKVAILFIDLDYFKTVNDTLGHDVGDYILQQVANRLRSVFRETDTVARFGGDEFVAVIPDVKDVNSVIQIAERVLKVFETPFDAGGEEVFLSASIGITLYPDNGTTATELIKNADMAMYKAKEEKNNFAFYTEELNEKAVEVLTLKNKLHKALDRGEFVLYYQPIYSIEKLRLEGMEALLRWNSPEEGLVPPDKFMSVLEELGLIKEVGRWVLEEAFKKSKEWGAEYGLFINVNISPKQFSDRNFIKNVLETAQRVGAENKKIVLEITETSLMKNPDESVRILKRLKSKGFKIAVDDFGTGYSSLSYLKKLPLDIIKIDMTFTQNMVTNKVDRSIVSAVIKLSKSLGLKSLAEGVERREQLNLLKDMGCDLVQGYLFGKPMPEEEAKKVIIKEKGI